MLGKQERRKKGLLGRLRSHKGGASEGTPPPTPPCAAASAAGSATPSSLGSAARHSTASTSPRRLPPPASSAHTHGLMERLQRLSGRPAARTPPRGSSEEATAAATPSLGPGGGSPLSSWGGEPSSPRKPSPESLFGDGQASQSDASLPPAGSRAGGDAAETGGTARAKKRVKWLHSKVPKAVPITDYQALQAWRHEPVREGRGRHLLSWASETAMGMGGSAGVGGSGGNTVSDDVPLIDPSAISGTVKLHPNLHALSSRTLFVQVVWGHDLRAADPNGLSDPYVIVSCGGASFRTKTVHNSLNPFWNETFTFPNETVRKSFAAKQPFISFNVYDDDGPLLSDDFLGQAEIDLTNVDLNERMSGSVVMPLYALVDGQKSTAGLGSIRVSMWLGPAPECVSPTVASPTPESDTPVVMNVDVPALVSFTSLVTPRNVAKTLPLTMHGSQGVLYEEPAMVYLVLHVWEIATEEQFLARLRSELSEASIASDRLPKLTSGVAAVPGQRHERSDRRSGRTTGRLGSILHRRFHRGSGGGGGGDGDGAAALWAVDERLPEGRLRRRGDDSGDRPGAHGGGSGGEERGGEGRDGEAGLWSAAGEAGAAVKLGVQGIKRGIRAVGDTLHEQLHEQVGLLESGDSDDGGEGGDASNDEAALEAGPPLYDDEGDARHAPHNAGRVFYRLQLHSPGGLTFSHTSRVAREIGGYVRLTRPCTVMLPAPISAAASITITVYYSMEEGAKFRPAAAVSMSVQELLVKAGAGAETAAEPAAAPRANGAPPPGAHAMGPPPRPGAAPPRGGGARSGMWLQAELLPDFKSKALPAGGKGVVANLRLSVHTIDMDVRRRLFGLPLVAPPGGDPARHTGRGSRRQSVGTATVAGAGAGAGEVAGATPLLPPEPQQQARREVSGGGGGAAVEPARQLSRGRRCSLDGTGVKDTVHTVAYAAAEAFTRPLRAIRSRLDKGPCALGTLSFTLHRLRLDVPLLPKKARRVAAGGCYAVWRCGPHWGATDPRPPRDGAVSWDWQVDLPLYEPNALLQLAVFPHAHSKWGSKRAGEHVLGRLRCRLSAMHAERRYCMELPLVSDRGDGAVRVVGGAVVALRVAWRSSLTALRRYTQQPLPDAVYELGVEEQVAELEGEHRRIVIAWLQSANPPVAPWVVRRVWGKERDEFYTSLLLMHWRRLKSALVSILGPAKEHVALLKSWERPVVNMRAQAIFTATAFYPSVMLPLLVTWVLVRRVLAGGSVSSAAPKGMMVDLVDDDSGDESAPPDLLGASPYRRLKHKYEELVRTVVKVQVRLGELASVVERLHATFSWEDPAATLLFVSITSAGAAAIGLLGLPLCASLAFAWLIRPPFMRTPTPPLPLNIFKRLPTNADRIG